VQSHHGLDSVSTELYFTVQDNSQNDTGAYATVSTANNASRSAYDCTITSRDFFGREDVRHQEGKTLVDEGPGPSIDEGNRAGKLKTSYTPPLIVTSPVVGIVPPDDDEGDDVTPEPTPSTPDAKPAPNLTEFVVAQSNTEPVKGPGGITYLPAYQLQASERPSEISFNSQFINGPPTNPEPKFYPPPPGATGSPNDKYRQVPRSGGAVRNPNRQPYQYPYGGSDHQQQQFSFPQQNIGHPLYNLPAGTSNQNQRPVTQPRQSFDQHPYPRGSYRARAHGKYDVRKARRGYDKNFESNRYRIRNVYQNGGRPIGSDSPSRFPLDPALEVNYRNYSRQNIYKSGHGQYSQNSSQNQYSNQNDYAGAPQFGHNAAYGNGYGNVNGYQYNYPAPPAFNNNSSYYAPSAYTAQEQEVIPSFSPEVGMMALTQMAAPPTQEQTRQPFIPSPFAVPFTPRSTGVRQENGEQRQGQAEGQNYPVSSEVHAFQYQLQGYGMLPAVPGSFLDAMPMRTGAELVDQVPLLLGYQRPKPVVSAPPIGEFSPPKARKNGRQAKKILEKVLAGTVAEATSVAALNADEGKKDTIIAADTDADELDDDGDGEYIPQNEGRKRKDKKPKKPKNKRGKGLGLDAKDEVKGGEGESDGMAGMEATTTTMAMAVPEVQTEAGIEADEKMAEG
jgi:hypothetical protein